MISSEAIAIVLATFLGPIAAVLVTRWNDARGQKRDRRVAIFRTLMATRRTAISPEHVTSINLIEVEFHGVQPVIDAWSTYITHLNTGTTPNATPVQRKAFDDRRAELLAILLVRIAKHLGIIKSEIEVLHGGYAPDGWRYRDEREGLILEFMADVASGRAALPMTLHMGPGTVSPYPPPPAPAAPTPTGPPAAPTWPPPPAASTSASSPTPPAGPTAQPGAGP